MAIWYMVKRLDTGEIAGHDMYWHGTLTGGAMKKQEDGTVEVWRHKNGVPHHLIVHVDGIDEEDANLMARLAFESWELRELTNDTD